MDTLGRIHPRVIQAVTMCGLRFHTYHNHTAFVQCILGLLPFGHRDILNYVGQYRVPNANAALRPKHKALKPNPSGLGKHYLSRSTLSLVSRRVLNLLLMAIEPNGVGYLNTRFSSPFSFLCDTNQGVRLTAARPFCSLFVCITSTNYNHSTETKL